MKKTYEKMSAYIRITSDEYKEIKKTVLKAMASSVAAQNTALKLLRLKKSKKLVMTGMATSLKESNQEIKKIKEALPESELLKYERAKPAKQAKPKAKGRTKYEQELEAIKQKISKLS